MGSTDRAGNARQTAQPRRARREGRQCAARDAKLRLDALERPVASTGVLIDSSCTRLHSSESLSSSQALIDLDRVSIMHATPVCLRGRVARGRVRRIREARREPIAR